MGHGARRAAFLENRLTSSGFCIQGLLQPYTPLDILLSMYNTQWGAYLSPHSSFCRRNAHLFFWSVMGLFLCFLLYTLAVSALGVGGGTSLFSASKSPAPAPSITTFHVTSGSNENYFYRDNITTAQLLVTSASASSNITRRLVAALPAGNNGALVYFLPQNEVSSTPLNLNLVNGTMKSVSLENGNKGIQADLTFTANATLGVTIVGAVRALRGEFMLCPHSVSRVSNGHRYQNTRLRRRFWDHAPDIQLYFGISLRNRGQAP